MNTRKGSTEKPPSGGTTGKAPWGIPLGFFLFFAFHQLWAMWFQVQNFFFYVRPQVPSPSFLAWVATRLPFIQFENLLMSLAAGFLFLPRLLHRTGRLFSGGAFLFLNGILLLNQISFHLTGNNLRMSFSEEGPFRLSLLWDSLKLGLDTLWIANLVLFTLLHLVFFSLFHMSGKPGSGIPDPDRPLGVSWSIGSSLLILALVGFSLGIPRSSRDFQLDRHPVPMLFEEWSSSGTQVPSTGELIRDFRKPVSPRPEEPVDEREKLHRACEKIRTSCRSPNIFIFVMESVGSTQLFDGGKPDPRLTPNIYGLYQSGILFDSVYTSFPATARAHISIVSGGDPFLDAFIFSRNASGVPAPNLLSEFRKNGYHTGLFGSSDLNFGNLDMLLKNLDFDMFFHFGIADKVFQGRFPLNSWGGSEEGTLEKIGEWLAAEDNSTAPILLEFLPNATHHPYSAPASFSSNYSGTDDESKYRHALHFVDRCLGDFLNMVKKHGRYDNSIIVLIGDHGEAFGKKHPGSFLHQSYLFDENVRSFFLFSSPCLTEGAVSSSRTGSLGDLLATLASLANIPLPEGKGRNMVSFIDEPRMDFFYKMAFPAKWGCRDGKYKFINNMHLPKDPEIYDLEADPLERTNLAPSMPEVAIKYDTACRSWFACSSRDLRDYLDPVLDFSKVIWPVETASWPADTVFMGTIDRDGNFLPRTRFHSRQRVFAAIRFGSPPAPNLKAEWVSPLGMHFPANLTIGSEPLQILTSFSGERPMTDGQWEVFLREDSAIRYNQTFVTDNSVPFQPVENGSSN